jgi:hypothetical protein
MAPPMARPAAAPNRVRLVGADRRLKLTVFNMPLGRRHGPGGSATAVTIAHRPGLIPVTNPPYRAQGDVCQAGKHEPFD